MAGAKSKVTCNQTQYCLPGAAITACDKVLIVHSVPASVSDVQSKLRGMGAFATVDTFDSRPVIEGGSGTPTLSQLAAYHAVLVMGGNGDATVLGDRMAAFHDQGGGVVVTYRANYADRRMQGAYGTPNNGYALLDYALGDVTGPPDSLGNVLEPQSPLMAGVASLSVGSAYRSTAPPIAGRAVVVARWRSNGQEPLVLRGMRGDRTLVELNFYPLSSDASSDLWTGDGAALLRNALKYSRCIPCGKGTFADAGDGEREGLCGCVWV